MSQDESIPSDFAERIRSGWSGGVLPRYRLTRHVLLRGLGFIYYVAFVSLATQIGGLLSSRGILPVEPFLRRVRDYAGSSASAFWELPSLFWFDHSDTVLSFFAWLGVALSLVVVAGYAHVAVLAALWVLYLSFVHVGQIFYGYGWEMLLLETGFLAMFLAPRRGFPATSEEPSHLVIVLLRWTLFRLMFGAGLIKVRGDPCWLDLSCLVYHYETQPNPHPLSWLLHRAPVGFHEFGVLFNHFAELLVPWGYFGPRRVRHVAGAITIVFQSALILSGNLSFLNWLTIVIALGCFDDGVYAKLLPRALVERLNRPEPAQPRRRLTQATRFGLGLVVLLLSINPIANMLSSRQRMNASFDPLHLVNTYGAFGTIGKTRYEVVLEGTTAERLGPDTVWRQYEFPCKPGDVNRAPCWITPFHYRLDWQMWFAALGSYEGQPWIVNLIHKLLQGEPRVLKLMAYNPFPNAPPHFIRARLYEYHFTRFGEPGWWKRRLVGEYLKPLSLDDEEFRGYLQRFGWL